MSCAPLHSALGKQGIIKQRSKKAAVRGVSVKQLIGTAIGFAVPIAVLLGNFCRIYHTIYQNLVIGDSK